MSLTFWCLWRVPDDQVIEPDGRVAYTMHPYLTVHFAPTAA